MGPRRTSAESAAGPLESARKVHPADPPEVRLKSARIRADPPRVRGGLKSAHLIAYYVDLPFINNGLELKPVLTFPFSINLNFLSSLPLLQ